MKKSFLSIGLFGLAFSLPVYSATYTHNLNYTHQTGDGNTALLQGRITFDESFGDSNDILGEFGGFTTINRSLITDITFDYTPFGGSKQTLTASDIELVRLDFVNNDGTTDFANANIKSQFSVMQFRTGFGASPTFNLVAADDFYALQAGVNDDFTLSETTYHSPGPLPLFGLMTAFTTIKKLKSKYKQKYKI